MTTENVLPLRRPPVQLDITVDAPIAHTFEVFVNDLGSWWPTHTFALAPGTITKVTVEPRVGGVIEETRQNGSTAEWGHVVTWNPPHEFAMTWNQTGTPTEVGLTFTAETDTRTRVQLEHRGWDRLTEEELSRACALPGGYLGGAFRSGWEKILQHFANYVTEEGPQ